VLLHLWLQISHIHQHWFGDYALLEQHHGYIQWLFPLMEVPHIHSLRASCILTRPPLLALLSQPGTNPRAQQLQRHEAEAIAASPELQAVLLTSFRLMLDFYGMRMTTRDAEDSTNADRGASLSPSSSFEVKHDTAVREEEIAVLPRVSTYEDVEGFVRTESYKERYRNFEFKPHNWLRLTRIIKCLGLCGLAEYQVSFCRFLLNEVRPSSSRCVSCLSLTDSCWVVLAGWWKGEGRQAAQVHV